MKYKKKILDLAEERERITIRDVDKELGISYPNASTKLKKLCDKGLLDRKRKDPNSTYKYFLPSGHKNSSKDGINSGTMPKTKILKSRQSFKKLFGDVEEIFGVTYSDSPNLILELFEDWGLEYLELVVGDSNDFREDIKDPGVADKLEELKEDGKLKVYVSEQQLHSKLYMVRGNDGTKFINTSANLTNNAHDGGYQKNYAHIFQVEEGSSWYRKFLEDYKEHKEEYGNLFLEDLTEKIEKSDKEREEVIKEWLEAEDIDASAKEREKVRKKLADKAVSRGEESEEFVIDTSELEKSTKSHLTRRLENLNVEHEQKNNRLTVNREQYRRSIEKKYGIPLMRLKDEKLILSANEINVLTSEPNDQKHIDECLNKLEEFFGLVDRFGRTNESDAVKAHMFEALSYMFFAPFSNEHMRILDKYGALGDKGFPFLYIHGESNSGKGTFSEFAHNLISNGEIRKSIPAGDVGKTEINGVKNVGTSFPFVIDDITKDGIRKINDNLRNYWKRWDLDTRYPSIVMISNDDKPKSWLKKRSKVLDFDVQFKDTPKERSAVNKVIGKENDIYEYFTHFLLRIDEKNWLEEDTLYPARRAFEKMYEYAERELPDYFPRKSVERIYDTGKEKWLTLFDDGVIDKENKGEKLILKFNGGMEGWEVDKYLREIPNHSMVRAERRGKRIIVKTPDAFKNWLQDSDSGSLGIMSKFRSLIGG